MQNKKNVTVRIRSLESNEENPISEDEFEFEACVSSPSLDAHFTRMTESTLNNFMTDAISGVPLQDSHARERLSDTLGNSIGARMDEDGKLFVRFRMLRDNTDTPEHLKVNEYIRRIERDILREMSVGFNGGEELCEIDNKDMWDFRSEDPCPHIPGQLYDGVQCTSRIENANLGEVSIVAMGSNPDTVINIRDLPEEIRKIKNITNEEDKERTLLERDGLLYRKTLIEKAIEEGIRAEGQTFKQEVWRERFEERSAEEIIDQSTLWGKLGDDIWGEGGRVTKDVVDIDKEETENRNTLNTLRD